MQLFIRSAEERNEQELKCFIALTATESPFVCKEATTTTTSESQAVPPYLQLGAHETIQSGNAIGRYLALAAHQFGAEDLAVEEYVQWEAHVLQPLRNAGLEANKQAVIEAIETQFKSMKKAQDFLVGHELSLADIILGATFYHVLPQLEVPSGEHATLDLVREYTTFLFEQKPFQDGLALLASGGKQESKLEQSMLLGKTYHGVLSIIEALFGEAIEASFPQMKAKGIAVEVTRTKNPKFGDYQCNSAMTIFKALKGTPEAMKAPRDVAAAIISAIPENAVMGEYSVAGPGFINVFLKPSFVQTRLENLLQNGPKPSPVEKQKVAVDFSSPNIAKDMHVGHLRSTIIGDAICRILEYQGHDVLRINHVGDWGTQFGMLICHLVDTYPNWNEEMPNVQDLTQLYKAAKQRFDEDPDFHERSKNQVVKLQSGDADSRKVWTTLCQISRQEFQKVYDRLGVHLEEYGESFYNDLIPSVIDFLKSKGITEESDGALVIFTKKFKQPFMLTKRDGSYLYDTTDIAALWYRLNELKADRIIYYTDYTQKDHFSLLFEVGRMAGIIDPKKHRVDHVGFGTVNGEDGKRFKTRSGDVVRLVDLLDEAKNRMKKELESRIESGQTSLPKEEVESAAEKIGYGAVKYFDLRQSPVSNYIFSYDRMLSTNGDTAVYLLFAYARLSSIIRKSGVDIESLRRSSGIVCAKEPTEVALAIEVLQLQDVIGFINRDISTNRLCAYLYTLAEKVQTFVTSCRVIGSEEQDSRLLLCDATLKVMHQCFSLLGIDPLDQI